MAEKRSFEGKYASFKNIKYEYSASAEKTVLSVIKKLRVLLFNRLSCALIVGYCNVKLTPEKLRVLLFNRLSCALIVGYCNVKLTPDSDFRSYRKKELQTVVVLSLESTCTVCQSMADSPLVYYLGRKFDFTHLQWEDSKVAYLKPRRQQLYSLAHLQFCKTNIEIEVLNWKKFEICVWKPKLSATVFKSVSSYCRVNFCTYL